MLKAEKVCKNILKAKKVCKSVKRKNDILKKLVPTTRSSKDLKFWIFVANKT